MVWRRVSYRFPRASGPERIVGEWWAMADPIASTRGHSAAPLSGLEHEDESGFPRDYFVAEDHEGRRFWLFRQGLYRAGTVPRWFLHGFFA
jgi:protein ImuB